MTMEPDFDIRNFLPYLLNMAAEEASLGFQRHYKQKYGMLRTEWRVLFHLGRYGDMTATDIVNRGKIHKTKVSRAVAALQKRGYVLRREDASDRRVGHFQLTEKGRKVYSELHETAQKFDRQLAQGFSPEDTIILRRCLIKIAGFEALGIQPES